VGSHTTVRLRKMRESRLENELAQAEEVYDDLLQTRRSLGTMLAETIREGRDLEEFKCHLRDLSRLIWQTDLRRTELRHQLLDRRARQAEDEYRRAAKEAEKTARSHEQARKASIKAQKAAWRSGLEARRLAEVCDKEAEQLQDLLRVPEDAQRYQGEHQRGKQGRERDEMRGGDHGAQKQRQQGEERAHDPSQAHDGHVGATSAASIAGEDANRGSAG
jgi:G3E family GTPase